MDEKKEKKGRVLISFSGGRTSAFMTQWLFTNKIDEFEFIVVFANTGKEREETLEFIEKCDKHFGWGVIWVEAVINQENGKGTRAKVVDFKTANRTGQPFEDVIKKHGVMNVRNPKCTRELKRYAIAAYAKSIGWKKYFTAIGIRSDEIDRVSPTHEKDRYLYPLVTMNPTTKNDINKFWCDMPFDLELKSYEGNCDLCFKKSFRKLFTIVNENPQLADWWIEMEKKYKNFIPDTQKHNPKILIPQHVFRQNTSIHDLVRNAKIQQFEPAQDESQYKPEYKQLSLYELYDLDISNGCSESCEVF
jgi:hypothetical protein